MKQDYDIYPSMIDAQPGIVWFYNNTEKTSMFNHTHPLGVQSARCNDLSICVWYISPLWQFSDPMKTEYALLGEWNKWTAVSRQRFLSMQRNADNTETTIVIQGIVNEMVSVVVYHSTIRSSIVKCMISAQNGQTKLVITPTNATCS